MPRGGARPGAGRPKKPLTDKLLEGNAGRRDVTVLKFKPQEINQRDAGLNVHCGGDEKIKPSSRPQAKLDATSRCPSYLELAAKEGGDVLPPATEIYTLLAVFVESAGCTEFVAPILIEDFAFLRRAYLECEFMNRKLGRIASGKRSPYVNMALDYQKAMMAVYNQIWLIIARNCEEQYEGKNEFLEMLRNRGF